MTTPSLAPVVWNVSLLLLLILPIHGWIVQRLPGNTRLSFPLASSASSSTLNGVKDFDEWFSKLDKAACQTSIEHATFGSLRGLECAGNEQGNILTVPKSVVLSSSYADEDWDCQLAVQLWNECEKGRASKLYGYCSLLTRGEQISGDSVPPSTAPNTLRHWSQDQLDALSALPRGKKLLALHEKQQEEWKAKYASLGKRMSWEQFEWAMEVVHSRAFCGNYGLDPVRAIGSAAAPLVAIALGAAYMQGNPDISDTVLLGLGALAAAPLLLNVLVPEEGEVVLLPLIDSANHLEQADSTIQYDPIKGVFSLSVGEKCLVKEDSASTQLYISYGSKSDAELLLNYGFLPGAASGDCDLDSAATDTLRQQLAAAFLSK